MAPAFSNLCVLFPPSMCRCVLHFSVFAPIFIDHFFILLGHLCLSRFVFFYETIVKLCFYGTTKNLSQKSLSGRAADFPLWLNLQICSLSEEYMVALVEALQVPSCKLYGYTSMQMHPEYLCISIHIFMYLFFLSQLIFVNLYISTHIIHLYILTLMYSDTYP